MKLDFLEPGTFSEAASLLAEHGDDAKLIAGGTAVVLMLKHKLIAPRRLISLGRIPGQDDISRDETGLRIGSLVSLRGVERSPVVRQFCPALARSFGVVGNVRVRNQATVGGNLAEADYASDPPAMLLALDSRVTVTGVVGEREIPLSELFLDFYTTALNVDDVITTVSIPALPPGARATYLRYTSRSLEDRPCVTVAAVGAYDDAGRCADLRLAVGAAVETPQRLREVEALAKGEELTDDLIAAIAERYARGIDPLSDARGSGWYRREMIRVFSRRALIEVRDALR